MAVTVADLTIKISANVGDAQRDISRISEELASIGRAAGLAALNIDVFASTARRSMSSFSAVSQVAANAAQDLAQDAAVAGASLGYLSGAAELAAEVGAELADELSDSAVANVELTATAQAAAAALNMLNAQEAHAAANAAALASAANLAAEAEDDLEAATASANAELSQQGRVAGIAAAGLSLVRGALNNVRNATVELATGANLAARSMAELGRDSGGTAALMGLVDGATDRARNSMFGLKLATDLAGRSLDKLRNDAAGAAATLTALGAAAFATDTKMAKMALALPAATLLGAAGGAAVVTTALAAAGAAAVGATGAFLGLGVFKNITAEGAPLAERLKEIETEMKKLEKAGKTNTAEYQNLAKEQTKLQAEYDKTAMGMMATTRKWVGEVAQEVSKPIFNAFKANLQKTVAALDDPKVGAATARLAKSVEDAVARMGKALGGDFYKPAELLVRVFDLMSATITKVSSAIANNMPLIQAWYSAFKMFGMMLGGPTLIALKAFGSSLAALNPQSAGFQASVERSRIVMRLFGDMFSIGGVAVTNFASGIVRGVSPALERMGYALQGVINRAGNTNAFLDKVDAVAQRVGRGIGALVGGFIEFAVSIGSAGQKLGVWSSLLKFFEGAVARVTGFLKTAGQEINNFAAKVAAGDAFAKFIFNFANNFEILTIAFFAASPIIAKVTLLLGLLMNPIGLLIVGTTALYSAWQANFAGIQGIVQPVIDRITIAVTYLMNVFRSVASSIEPFIKTLTAIQQIMNPAASGFDLLQQKLEVVHSAFTMAAQRIGTELAVMAGRIITGLAQVAPQIMTMAYQWGVGLVAWTAPIAGYLGEKLATLAATVLNWISSNTPMILSQAMQWGIALVEWTAPIAGMLVGKLAGIIGVVLSWIGANSGLILTTFASWSVAFVQWLVPVGAMLLSKLGETIGQIGAGIVSAAPQIAQAAQQWGIALVQGFLGAGAVDQFREVINTIGVVVGGVASVFGKLASAIAPVMPVVIALGAAFLGAQAAIAALTPVFLGLVGVAGSLLAPITGLISGVISMGAAFIGAGGGLAGITAALAAVISPVGILIGLAVAFGAAFVTNFAGVRDATMGVVSAIGTSFAPVLQQVGGFIQGTVIPAISGMVTWLGSTLTPVVSAAGALISGHIVPALANFATMLVSAGQFVFGLVQVVGAFLAPVLEALGGLLAGVVFPAIGLIFDAFGLLWGIISNVAGFLTANVLPAFSALAGFLGGVLGAVITTITNGIKQFVGVLGGVVEAIGKVFTGDFVGAGESLGRAFDGAAGKAQEAKASFDATATSVKSTEKTFVESSQRVATGNATAGKSFAEMIKGSQDAGMGALTLGKSVQGLTGNYLNNAPAGSAAAKAAAEFGQKAAESSGATRSLTDEISRLQGEYSKSSGEASAAQQGMSNLEAGIKRLNPAIEEQWNGYKKAYEAAHKAGFANADLNAQLARQESGLAATNPKANEYAEAWKIAYDAQFKAQKSADDNTASIWLNKSAMEAQQSAFKNAQAAINGTSKSYTDSATASGQFGNSLTALSQVATAEFQKLPQKAQEELGKLGQTVLTQTGAFVPLTQQAFAGLSPAAQAALSQLAPITQQELSKLPPAAQLQLAQLGQTVTNATNSSVPALRSALSQLSPVAQAEFAKLPFAAQTELARLGPVTQQALGTVSPAAQTAFAGLPPAVQAELAKLVPATQAQLSGLAPITAAEFARLPVEAQRELAGMGMVVAGEAGKMLPITKDQFAQLSPAVQAELSRIAPVAQGEAAKVAGALTAGLGGLPDAAQGPAQQTVANTQTELSRLSGVAQTEVGKLPAAVESAAAQTPQAAADQMQQVNAQVQAELANLAETGRTAVTAMQTAMVSSLGILSAASVLVTANLITTITNEFNKLGTAADGGISALRGYLSAVDFTAQGQFIGGSLVDGIVAGITARAPAAAAAAAGAAAQAAAAAQSALQIASPSKLFAWMGMMLMDGLALGIDDNADKPVNSLDELVGQVDSKVLDGLIKQGEAIEKTAQAASALAEALAKLRDYTSVGRASIDLFLADATYLVNNFMSGSKGFTEEMSKAAGFYLDTASKVADVVSKMADALTKLKDYTAVGKAQIRLFIDDTYNIVMGFADAAKAFSIKMLAGANLFSETALSVAETVLKMVEALDAIRDYQRINRKTINDFSLDARDITVDFAYAAQHFTKEMHKAAREFSETALSVAETVLKMAEALIKIREHQRVNRQAITDFSFDVRDTVADFAYAAMHFTEEMLTNAAAFSDTASKVADTVLKMAGALKAVAAHQRVNRQAITDFSFDVRDITADFASAATHFTAEMLEGAAAFADTAARVGEAIGKIAPGFDALRTYTAMNRDIMTGFVSDLVELVSLFAEAGGWFDAEMFTAANSFADTAGKAAETVGKGVEGLSRLTDFEAPASAAMTDFTRLLVELVELFAEAGGWFDTAMFEAANAFSDSAGKAAETVGKGVEGFSKLRTLGTVPQGAIAAFVAGLKLTVEMMAVAAESFKSEALEKVAAFGEATGALFDGLKSAVDLFDALKEYKGVAAATLRAFVNDVNVAVNLAGEMASQAEDELLEKVSDFGEAVGSLFDGLSSAIDVFDGLNELKGIPVAALDALLFQIKLTVVKAAQMSSEMSSDLVGQAQTFLSGAESVFGLVKNATETLASLEQVKAAPVAGLDALLSGVLAAVGKMGDAVKASEDILERAKKYAANMKAAAAAANTAPSVNPPSGSGSGSSGGGGGNDSTSASANAAPPQATAAANGAVSALGAMGGAMNNLSAGITSSVNNSVAASGDWVTKVTLVTGNIQVLTAVIKGMLLTVGINDYWSERIEAFSKSVQSQIGMLTEMITFVNYAAENYRGMAGDMIPKVGYLLDRIADIMWLVYQKARQYSGYNTDLIGKFSDNAAKIVAMLGPTIENFNKLPEYQPINPALITRLATDMATFIGLMTNFVVYGGIDLTMINAAALFAEAAGKILSLVGAGVENLSKLTEYTRFLPRVAYDFVNDVVLFARLFAVAVYQAYLDGEMLDAALKFADLAEKVVGLVGDALESFAALKDYSGVSLAALNALVRDTQVAAAAVITASATVNLDMLGGAVKFAEAVSKVFGGLKNAIDLFAGLAQYTGIAPIVVGLFVDDVKRTATLLAVVAAPFNEALLNQVAAFGQTTEAVFEGLAKALDVFVRLAIYESFDPALAARLFADLRLIMGAASGLFNGNPQALAQLTAAMSYFQSLATFTESLKTTIVNLEALQNLMGGGGNTAAGFMTGFQALLGGITSAIGAMSATVSNSQTLLGLSQTYRNNLAAVADNIRQGAFYAIQAGAAILAQAAGAGVGVGSFQAGVGAGATGAAGSAFSLSSGAGASGSGSGGSETVYNFEKGSIVIYMGSSDTPVANSPELEQRIEAGVREALAQAGERGKSSARVNMSKSSLL